VEGWVITVDGDAGEVRAGESAAAESVHGPDLLRFADIVCHADAASAEPLRGILLAAGLAGRR
jgi:hypothetical protein